MSFKSVEEHIFCHKTFRRLIPAPLGSEGLSCSHHVNKQVRNQPLIDKHGCTPGVKQTATKEVYYYIVHLLHSVRNLLQIFFISVCFCHVITLIIIRILIVFAIVGIRITRQITEISRWCTWLASWICWSIRRVLAIFVCVNLHLVRRSIIECGYVRSRLGLTPCRACCGYELWFKVCSVLILMTLSPFMAGAMNGAVIFIVEIPFPFFIGATFLLMWERAFGRLNNLLEEAIGLVCLLLFWSLVFLRWASVFFPYWTL